MLLAQMHLIESMSLKVLGLPFQHLKLSTQNSLTSEIGLEEVPKHDWSEYTKPFKEKFIYMKELLFSLKSIKSREWGKALQALHRLIQQNSSYTTAETFLLVLLLKLCSEA